MADSRSLIAPSDSLFAHCVCEPPALAGAVATVLALASGDGLCGRKKLPFAGYSVVKEPLVKQASCRWWSAACAARFYSNLFRITGRERYRSTNLPILRS
jgi:hypothetical protein